VNFTKSTQLKRYLFKVILRCEKEFLSAPVLFISRCRWNMLYLHVRLQSTYDLCENRRGMSIQFYGHNWSHIYASTLKPMIQGVYFRLTVKLPHNVQPNFCQRCVVRRFQLRLAIDDRSQTNFCSVISFGISN
jgi:hypothetical protein